MGVVFLHVGNVTHQQVTKNADEQGEESHQGEVDGSSVQMDANMEEDDEDSSSVLHTSPGELRGRYDVCLLVCTPCCAGALRLSQRLSLFLRVSSACGWEPRMHFEKSTTCLTRVYTKNAGDLEGESSESMTASQEALSSQQTTSTIVFTPVSFLESDDPASQQSVVYGGSGPTSQHSIHSQTSNVPETPLSRQDSVCQGSVYDSPSTSRQREISSEFSGRPERGEDTHAANNIEPAEGLCQPYASVGGDDTVWAESTVGDYSVQEASDHEDSDVSAESTVGDYSVQEASDHEDSDVSLTTMHSRLQQLVFDYVDNEAGLVIVDFESNDGREMKHKLLVRSIFYYLP